MSTPKPDAKGNLLKNAIVTGVISSVIFTFLFQPLVLKLWPLLKNSGLQLYTTFNNKIFAAAALGYRYDVERVTSTLYSAILFFLIFFSIIIFSASWGSSNSLKKIRSKLDVSRILKSKAITWITRILYFLLILAMLIFSVRQLLSTILIYASTELNSAFQQRINIVTPYIPESEKASLISSWALMRNETDYTTINEQIESIAEENGIILPKVLWPDVLNNDYAWP